MPDLQEATRAQFLYAVEMRLKAWGFKGELWTDGTHLTIDGKVVAPKFEIGNVHEVLRDLTCHSGLSADAELVAGIVDEIGIGLELFRWATCNGCAAPYKARLDQRYFHSDGRCSVCKENGVQVEGGNRGPEFIKIETVVGTMVVKPMTDEDEAKLERGGQFEGEFGDGSSG